MSLIVMLGCGIMFGIGYSLAPYIILTYKARSMKNKAKKLEKQALKQKRKIQKKGEYIE